MIHIPQIMGDVLLDVRLCAPLFHVSGTAGRIALRLVRDPINYVFYGSQGWSTSARARVHTLFCISGTAGRIVLKFGMWIGTY